MGTGPKATIIRWGEENKRYKQKYPQIKQNDRKEELPFQQPCGPQKYSY